MTNLQNARNRRLAGSISRGSWSEAELQHLRELLASGASAVRAAAILNRKSAAVKSQTRKLGSAFLGMQEARRRRQAKMLAAQPETAMTLGRADEMDE